MTTAPSGAPLNIANGVREFARATPDAVAVIDGDRRLTYRQLHERAARLAQSLTGRGLTAGARVAVCLGNRLEHPEIACGIAMAGMTMVPLNPRYTAAEATFILEHSESAAVIADAALAAVVAPAVAAGALIALAVGDAEASSPTTRRSPPRPPWTRRYPSTRRRPSVSPTPRAPPAHRRAS